MQLGNGNLEVGKSKKLLTFYVCFHGVSCLVHSKKNGILKTSKITAFGRYKEESIAKFLPNFGR